MSQHTNNTVNSLERVYAQALLDLAQQAKQTSDIADELEQLGDLINQQPQLLAVLANRLLSVAERASTLEKVFKGRVSDLLYRFLLVVNNKHRLDSLPGIVHGYKQLLDEQSGVVEADVHVAAPLSDSETQSIAGRISQAIDRNVVLRQHVDPNLIGGLKVRVGDRLIDGSVATQLRLIRHALAEAGHENARTKFESLIHE